MSAAHHSGPAVAEPTSFEFTDENLELAKRIIAKYPEGRRQSAVMPLLDLAQRQNGGWLPKVAIDYVATFLDIAPIRAMEVASFYTMYNLKPVGKHFVQVCTTTPCWLRGSDEVLHACESKLGIKPGQTTQDGQFTVIEVECLGACVNAPMMQIGDDFYEDLTAETTGKILDALARGEKPEGGPQNGRIRSCPIGGPTTLTESATRAGVKPAGQA
ncbi:NADH-quinone oxidoreductase subunit NuoE [Niveispirillum fermenti]|uniref:NADH-quinone oxidoreductase subunit NuoE n=1 Tax=Niveispirillum fermenti TaxID=1233113 RepID=UPI003A8AC14A